VAKVRNLLAQSLYSLARAQGLSSSCLIVAILFGHLDFELADGLSVFSSERLELLDHVLCLLKILLEREFA